MRRAKKKHRYPSESTSLDCKPNQAAMKRNVGSTQSGALGLVKPAADVPSLAEIKRSIPDHCFKSSLASSVA